MARCGEGLAILGYMTDHAWEKGKRRLGAEGPNTVVKEQESLTIKGNVALISKDEFGAQNLC
uniref:Uncharacterized protein n=1 Tax=Oryza barthii TaxID=65489 RepID=A0A0D3H045_9ORYZ